MKPVWHPDQFAKKRGFLEKRQKILKRIRAYFEAEDFMEVDTPSLQISPGIEVHLKAFETRLEVPHLDISQTYYLHTSPEFAMKKLLVAGLEKIYQICHVFRNEAYSEIHRPEFLMMEWYRVGASLEEIMQDCENLIRQAASEVGVKQIAVCDLFQPWERLSVYEAFKIYAKLDIRPAFSNPQEPSLELFRTYAKEAGCTISDQDLWDDLFFKIFLKWIEPHLGQDRPTFLTDYPVAMAALARVSPKDASVAERFELYINGIELANAFGELTNVVEQQKRFEADLTLKEKLYGERYPIDQSFLEALAYGMPEASGIALGLDRLIMLLVGAGHIDDVNFL